MYAPCFPHNIGIKQGFSCINIRQVPREVLKTEAGGRDLANVNAMKKHVRSLLLHKGKLIVLGFNDTSTLEGHFVSSPREREKRDRRESRGDEREGQGRKRNRNESEETEEIKTFPLYPYPLQG